MINWQIAHSFEIDISILIFKFIEVINFGEVINLSPKRLVEGVLI